MKSKPETVVYNPHIGVWHVTENPTPPWCPSLDRIEYSLDDDFEPEGDVTEDVFDFMTREREEDDDVYTSS